MENKIKALAEELNIDAEDITEVYEDTFEADGAEYMVLTDEEAEERVSEHIKESIWAFNAGFLASNLGCPVEAVEGVQANDKCEDNNDTFLEWIRVTGDFEQLVFDAIVADGRGHFLSGYDGEEIEQGEYYIYRTN